MQLTLEGDYAVRVVVELAARQPGAVVRTEELTGSTQVSRAHLAKIIQSLARAGLVQTRQGSAGGVSLRRDPGEITLRQMVEAVEGPILLNRCLARPGECARDSFCPVHPVWARIQALLVRELDAVTARDLARGAPAPRVMPRGGESAAPNREEKGQA
jgi:Rrf2 family protein